MMSISTVFVFVDLVGISVFDLVYQLTTSGVLELDKLDRFDPNNPKSSTIAYFFPPQGGAPRPYTWIGKELGDIRSYLPKTKRHYSEDPSNKEFFRKYDPVQLYM